MLQSSPSWSYKSSITSSYTKIGIIITINKGDKQIRIKGSISNIKNASS